MIKIVDADEQSIAVMQEIYRCSGKDFREKQ
jgi:hypothetical protein